MGKCAILHIIKASQTVEVYGIKASQAVYVIKASQTEADLSVFELHRGQNNHCSWWFSIIAVQHDRVAPNLGAQ